MRLLVAHFKVSVTKVIFDRVKALEVIFIRVLGVIQLFDSLLPVVAVDHGLGQVLLGLRPSVAVGFGRAIIIGRNMVWIHGNR